MKVYVSAGAEVEVNLSPFPGASRSGLESARPASLFLQQFANGELSEAAAGSVTFLLVCVWPGSRGPGAGGGGGSEVYGPLRRHSHTSPGGQNTALKEPALRVVGPGSWRLISILRGFAPSLCSPSPNRADRWFLRPSWPLGGLSAERQQTFSLLRWPWGGEKWPWQRQSGAVGFNRPEAGSEDFGAA